MKWKSRDYYGQYIVNGEVKDIGFTTLDVVCKTLNCQFGDILEYVEEDDKFFHLTNYESMFFSGN